MITQTNGTYRFTTRSSIADGIMFLAFIGGIALLIVGFTNDPAMWLAIAGGAGCLVLGALLLFVFKFKKTVAEISVEGITEHGSKVSKGVVRWDEIADVSVYETFGTNSLSPRDQFRGRKDSFVGIFLIDAEEYMKRLNPVQRGLMKLNLKLGQAPVNIPCNLLGDDTARFVELCKEKLALKQ